LEAGKATPEAGHRARAERAQVEQQLAEARDRQLAATRAFNLLLERPLDAPAEAIPDSVHGRPLDFSEDIAVSHGLAAREELQESDAAVRAALAGTRAATAGFLPSLTAALDYG